MVRQFFALSVVVAAVALSVTAAREIDDLRVFRDSLAVAEQQNPPTAYQKDKYVTVQIHGGKKSQRYRLGSNSVRSLMEVASKQFGETVERLVDFHGRPVLDLDAVANEAVLNALPGNDFFMFDPVRVNHTYIIKAHDRNVTVRTLAMKPRIFLVEDLLDEEECNEIIGLAGPKLERSKVVSDDATKPSDKQAEHQSRTSSSAFLYPNDWNDPIKRMRLRLHDVIQMPEQYSEGVQVVNYKPNQFYRAHYDYFDPNVYGKSRQIGREGGNRIITLLVYLNSVESGGETNFPYAVAETPNELHPDLNPVMDFADCSKGLSVKPKRGAAVLWYNLEQEGQWKSNVDRFTLHAGCPMGENDEKWAVNYWIVNYPGLNVHRLD